MGATALFTLADGTAAAAPLPEGREAPAAGSLCIVREGGPLEAARFRGLREGAPPRCAIPCEFVSVATAAERARAEGNDEAVGRVRAAVRKWFADEGREAVVARFRFSLRRERLSSFTSLHLLFKSKPSLRFDLGRGFFSVSSNFKPTKCLKFEGDKLPGPTKKLRFAGLRVLRAIRSGPFGGLKWTRTTDLTIISRVL